ncbi:MAG: tyrosine--tRNA ligase [Rhodospirillaceae bacterium]|nr:tyrosine--tRNA ligase [Rhodospirillaceae bacterium]|tara:strand:+ start:1265 stop:2533 length:1269 start_codon:yes stop_codon:yes gene_type:complete
MTTFQSQFLQTVYERGYVHQCTNAEDLDKELVKQYPLTAYIGFDCTADSLHVGSLLPIMLLRIFQKSGHKPIIVLGGATTKVGDPSGKDDSRQILTEDEISANMAGIHTIFERFLSFGNLSNDAVIINNSDWLSDLSYIKFLREYGKFFSINRMLSFDSVKLRLEREQPLSFLEFNYMILQAYDFLQLYRQKGCILQMGGSDQWGNIVNGVELGRRAEGATLFGLTSPLVTTTAGEKMGKTAQGAIWLNEKKLSAYEYYQFWRNTADKDVGKFLRFFTEIPLNQIKKIDQLNGSELNAAKKLLAFHATALCHGEIAARKAENTSISTFERGTTDPNLPTVSISKNELKDGLVTFSAFVFAGLAKSNGEARRLIRGGGASINDEMVTNETAIISEANITDDGTIKLSAGKKRHALIRVEIAAK